MAPARQIHRVGALYAKNMEQMNLFNTPKPSKLVSGEELKAKGMGLAIDNAEKVYDGWKERALEFITLYPGNKFMAEDIREYAYSKGLPRPPSERAWGSVISAAKKRGLITHCGYGQVTNPDAHKTPASIWAKV